MKTASANLTAHIAGTSTTLAMIWAITRTDGTILRFTDHHDDLEFPPASGLIYSAAIIDSATALATNSNLTVDNMDVLGLIDSVLITDDDLRKGLFDYASVHVSIVNYEALADGEIKVRNGWLGEVSLKDNGTYKSELRGMTQAFDQQFMAQYGTLCRANLGDIKCQIPIDPPIVAISTVYALGDFVKAATGGGTFYEVYENRIYECTTPGTTAGTPPAYDTTVGNTTADGTVVWTARLAWSIDAVVATVTSNRIFSMTFVEARAIDDWFKYGQVFWDTGDNSGIAMEVKGWLNSGSPAEAEITLFLSMPFDIQVGDKLHINVGCDKLFLTCRDTFDNMINRRAEDYIPGLDEILRYPDAK